MKEFEELLQKADWKQEKHVPVIMAQKMDDAIQVEATVGKGIAHPNTTVHHIAWMELYFLPDKGAFPYLIGRYDFAAHGASAEGADTSTVYTVPKVTMLFKTEKSGTIYALSCCNVHGLWANKEKLNI